MSRLYLKMYESLPLKRFQNEVFRVQKTDFIILKSAAILVHSSNHLAVFVLSQLDSALT
jgi:hypothetical protein